jgi:Uma2 family endonuclease
VNPVAVIEVLSPRTEAMDRGRKFQEYRRIESLREYVPRVERGGAGRDIPAAAERQMDSQHVGRPRSVAPVGVELSLAEVYEGIEFSAASMDRPAI